MSIFSDLVPGSISSLHSSKVRGHSRPEDIYVSTTEGLSSLNEFKDLPGQSTLSLLWLAQLTPVLWRVLPNGLVLRGKEG